MGLLVLGGEAGGWRIGEGVEGKIGGLEVRGKSNLERRVEIHEIWAVR